MREAGEPMELIGGIETYIMLLSDPPKRSRHESSEPPYGRIVYFLNKNGFDLELEDAQKYFTKDQALTVKEIYVGRSSSTVEFVELPNKHFNTVMFTDQIKGD